MAIEEGGKASGINRQPGTYRLNTIVDPVNIGYRLLRKQDAS
jgi:hypothetical protein